MIGRCVWLAYYFLMPLRRREATPASKSRIKSSECTAKALTRSLGLILSCAFCKLRFAASIELDLFISKVYHFSHATA